MRVALKCGPSMTVQAHKDECDINVIVKRGLQSGYLVDPTKKRREPLFGDFTTGGDFEQAQNTIAQIQSDFMELPSHIRQAFENSPSQLLNALDDPSQKDKLIELGVIELIERSKSDAEIIGEAVANAIKPGEESA